MPYKTLYIINYIYLFMKKGLKWLLGILLFLGIIVAALYVIRQNQIKTFNAKFIPAQYETQQSILAFAHEKSIPGEILVAKDTAGYATVRHLFSPGTIFILDAKMKIVDINYGNYKGSCYFDIAKYICDDFNFTKSKYTHAITDTSFISDLTTSTLFITDFTWEKAQGYDFIVCFCWAKWMITSYTNDGAVQQISDCIKKNTKRKILLVSVNSDCVTPWFPSTMALPASR